MTSSAKKRARNVTITCDYCEEAGMVLKVTPSYLKSVDLTAGWVCLECRHKLEKRCQAIRAKYYSGRITDLKDAEK